MAGLSIGWDCIHVMVHSLQSLGLKKSLTQGGTLILSVLVSGRRQSS